MEVMDGGEEIPLNLVRPCGMEVPPNGALNMKESPPLIIGYLLSNEWEKLESKFYGRKAKVTC